MNQTIRSILVNLNPAVPRRYLFFLAGALWTLAGAMLCWRAEVWFEEFALGTELLLETICAVLGAAGYLYVFIRIVTKNIERITVLPERACLFAFTAWRGYFLIACMIGLGLALRSSSIPKYILSVPYTIMGVVLLIGSAQFYRQYFLARASRV